MALRGEQASRADRLAASGDGAAPFLPPPPLSSSSTAAQGVYFSRCAPWAAMASALDLRAGPGSGGADGWPPGVPVPPMPLSSLLAAGRRSIARVPLVIGLVARMRTSEADLILLLRDATGAVTACATRRVLEEAGPALAPGAVIVLRGSAVFSPTPASRYLNVVPDNVAGVFPPWAAPPKQRRPTPSASLPSSAGRKRRP